MNWEVNLLLIIFVIFILFYRPEERKEGGKQMNYKSHMGIFMIRGGELVDYIFYVESVVFYYEDNGNLACSVTADWASFEILLDEIDCILARVWGPDGKKTYTLYKRDER